MRKIVIHRPGSYDRLRIEECANLIPGSQEVLIDVEAIGINYADCLTRMGLYASAKHYMGYPITPGFEVAGRVVSTSPEVTSVRVGMPVMAVTLFNGYATQVVVNQKQVFQLPESLSLQEAAGFPSVFLTAWFALLLLAHP